MPIKPDMPPEGQLMSLDQRLLGAARMFLDPELQTGIIQPDDAYRLVDYLLQPEQMIERARIAGELPTRPALYGTRELAAAVTMPPADALAIIEHATPRPVTPVYSQLSEILQVSLHRALTRQQTAREALHEAAGAMRALLARAKLAPPT